MGDIESQGDAPESDDSRRDVATDPPVMESMGPIQMTTLAFPGNRFKARSCRSSRS
jgi:hypothetical protein